MPCWSGGAAWLLVPIQNVTGQPFEPDRLPATLLSIIYARQLESLREASALCAIGRTRVAAASFTPTGLRLRRSSHTLFAPPLCTIHIQIASPVPSLHIFCALICRTRCEEHRCASGCHQSSMYSWDQPAEVDLVTSSAPCSMQPSDFAAALVSAKDSIWVSIWV